VQLLLLSLGHPSCKPCRLSSIRTIRLLGAMTGKIGTHNGKFHTDEVLACWMLKRLPSFKDYTITRTRDPEELRGCNIVVDVGGVYDPDTKRFDHHQKEFNHTLNSLEPKLDFHTRLSSAGLVYTHFGRDVLREITGAATSDEESKNIEILFRKMYKNFIESVDAVDNGIAQFDGTPRYLLADTLDAQVDHLNPAWNEPDVKPDDQFQKAMKLAGDKFEDRVRYYWNSWLPARKIVYETVSKRKEVHPSGKIVFMEGRGVPFKDHFFEIEEEKQLAEEDICIAIFDDSMNKQWRILALSVSPTSQFKSRVTIPWGGLRDQDLEKESGIDGATFVHVTGFTGGAKTKAGVLKMAEETLKRAGKL